VSAAGFSGTKVDTVVMRGVNEDELADLIEYGKTVAAEVRFIEYMDVGGATRWSMEAVVSRARCSRRSSAATARIDPVRRAELGARGPVPAPRRHVVRDHLRRRRRRSARVATGAG